MKYLYRTILYKCMGWKLNVTVPNRKKSILCVAPHTSNWDFIIGILYRKSIGFSSYFLMKKEWFFFPLGIILKHMGGIPVCRTKKEHVTDQLAGIIRQREEIHIAITPEGTRSKNIHWKKGFYFIARAANIPIQLYAIDYEARTIVCNQEIIPGDNMEEDFRKIRNYYELFASKAKFPQKFTTDETM